VSSEQVGGAGGTCVIRGCVPKKLLVYASSFRDEFEDAVGFGWAATKPPHNWQALIANKAKEIQRLNSVYVNLLKNAGVTYLEGFGSLVDAHTVEVRKPDGSTSRITAKNILVATGGSATKLPIEGAEHAITSDEALALDNLPDKDVLIVGSGYIAVEFAGIFAGLGAHVHLAFRADKVLRGFDEDCRAQVQENLGKKGVTCHPGYLPTRIAPAEGGGYDVTLRAGDGGAELALHTGLVMMATGRHPKTAGLNLEGVGVARTRTGAIQVDALSRTSVPSIWAIGDVTNRIDLTPVALMEGMAFAKTCFGGVDTAPDYQFVPSAVFCQPPLASVGWSEEQAAEALSGPIDVYTSKFKPMKYTISGRDERTFMKLLVHAPSDRVVGVHMVGPDAAEIMQGLAVAVKCGATKAQFDATVGIHPSAAEEFVTMRSKTRTIEGRGQARL
jgi:glutathione reductase (NADPH)